MICSGPAPAAQVSTANGLLGRIWGARKEELERGWLMVRKRLAKGWQRVGKGFPCTLQLCNSRNSRLEERVCDPMDNFSVTNSCAIWEFPIVSPSHVFDLFLTHMRSWVPWLVLSVKMICSSFVLSFSVSLFLVSFLSFSLISDIK